MNINVHLNCFVTKSDNVQKNLQEVSTKAMISNFYQDVYRNTHRLCVKRSDSKSTFFIAQNTDHFFLESEMREFT